MKLELEYKDGTKSYLDVVAVFVDSEKIGYAHELYVNCNGYQLDAFDLIKLDEETIYLSEDKLQEQEETLRRIIDEYGSLGGFFEYCIKMVNGGPNE